MASAFNEGNAFRGLGHYGIHVIDLASSTPQNGETPTVEGSGKVEALVDQHANDAADATELAVFKNGRLISQSDIDYFKITLNESGTLTIFSSGPTDVKGSLEEQSGSVLAEDDDGGKWYNFKIEKPVNPGTYFVRVTHCCAGTGTYRISYDFIAN